MFYAVRQVSIYKPNNCTVITYNDLQTCGKPPVSPSLFLTIQGEVFDKENYFNGYLCHRRTRIG